MRAELSVGYDIADDIFAIAAMTTIEAAVCSRFQVGQAANRMLRSVLWFGSAIKPLVMNCP